MEAGADQFETKRLTRANYLWIEVGIVLLACLVPFLFDSWADVHGWRTRVAPTPFAYRALTSIVQYSGQIAFVLFVIWRSGDSFSRFGIVPFKAGRDLFGSIALVALAYGLHYLLWFCLR